MRTENAKRLVKDSGLNYSIAMNDGTMGLCISNDHLTRKRFINIFDLSESSVIKAIAFVKNA